jgi:type IV fimbrial biogenesis protein FimT
MGRRGGAGFTLVELLVVVALVSVLSFLAVPALGSAINSARLSSATHALFSSFVLARSEAIKRKSRTVVCKSPDGFVCTTSGGWEHGWIVFHDPNNNATADAGEPVLARHTALPGEIRFDGNFSHLSYVPGGSVLALGGTLTGCYAASPFNPARQIVISKTGRPRTVRTTVPNCF